MKITLLLQNVSSPVGSILEACWRKVPFSDELLPDEPRVGKLVGATLLSGPGLLEKLILRPPTIVFFVVEGPGERAAISLYSSISTTLLTFDEF